MKSVKFLVVLMSIIILVGFQSFLCSSTRSYYISPDPYDNDTCGMDGDMVLQPCFSLKELDEEDMLSNNGFMTLILLPRTHIIYRNFNAFNISVLEIIPWSEQKEVLIDCQMLSKFVFHGIEKLEINSVTFNSCSLEYDVIERDETIVNDTVAGLIHIENCVFANSREDFAVTIQNDWLKLKISVLINRCNFSSNNGALNLNPDVEYVGENNIDIVINDTMFLNNFFQDDENGILYMFYADMKLSKSVFSNNTAPQGGAIDTSYSSMIIESTIFQNNQAYDGDGGAINSFATNLTILNCSFLRNSARKLGGAIYVTDFYAVVVKNTVFMKNKANSGGAIFSEYANIMDSSFKGNLATVEGGALYFYESGSNDRVSIVNTHFTSNQAGLGGGAVFCAKCSSRPGLRIDGGYSHINSALNGGFVYLSACKLTITRNNFDIIGNNATKGGAIYAKGSTVEFEITSVTLEKNTAKESGGAMYLISSQITTIIGSRVKFYQNKVTSESGKGGAIFFLDNNNCELKSGSNGQCFIKVSYHSQRPFLFLNNSAANGPVLYGGLLDRCFQRNSDNPMKLNGIQFFKEFSVYSNASLAITSDPVKLCLCSNLSLLNCEVRELSITKMRGQAFNLKLTSVDQDQHSLASIIKANYEESSAELGKGEGRKRSNECNLLSYHIFTAYDSATLVLQPEGPCERSPLSIFTIHVSLTSCSVGFEQKNDRCSCDRRLIKYVTLCDIDTYSVKKKGSTWLRYDDQHLKIHRNCPLDYCQVSSDTISLLSPNEQCANHRSGVICGSCQDNYSIALGSSHCLHCTSHAFIWLILGFAVAGMALVALLLVCNVTTSAGTLEGLIFYANVISISGLTGLESCSIHPILSVFVAWVNLDLGIETCFYPGMDTYQRTWLQFAFPLYIWLLVGAIIVASHYSSTAMKLFGSNNIAILATLFLLSYTKVLKTIITALSFTQVLKSNANDVTAELISYKVWTYDGNIEYLKGGHVALFIVALLFLLFLFLPYTLLLIFGQCLRSMSVRRRWIMKVIFSTAFTSIMDAYHAPYNRRHRYWTGFMLLTRCILFLVFATIYRESDSRIVTNMYITTLVVSGILTIKTCITKVYKKNYLNILEISFLLNLLILSATLYYLKGTNSSESITCKSTSASISVSLLTFIGILAYHTYLQARKTRFYRTLMRLISDKLPKKVKAEEDILTMISANDKSAEKKLPTRTLVELREELLASDK